MDLAELKRVFGVLPQEYLCVAKENVALTPSVQLSSKDFDELLDVTQKQLLLGYNPLIMAVKLEHVTDRICLSFVNAPSQQVIRWRGFLTNASAIGWIELKKLGQSIDGSEWKLFVGVYGQHRFLRPHQQLANVARSLLKQKPASNANIFGNLYDQVRVAYSTPRQIAVITVKDNDLLNFFPTDLHGRLGKEHYISSLRIGGMACTQVETCKRIVISTVDAAAFKDVYALGKNHMQNPKPPDHFETSAVKSPEGIPVYPLATSYLELEVIRHFDVGIHRLFEYRITAERVVTQAKTLAHLHAYYVQWRLNHGISTEYFLR